MGKGFFKSIAKGITAPIQFVGKIHRETFRIIDQGLEKANAADYRWPDKYMDNTTH